MLHQHLQRVKEKSGLQIRLVFDSCSLDKLSLWTCQTLDFLLESWKFETIYYFFAKIFSLGKKVSLFMELPRIHRFCVIFGWNIIVFIHFQGMMTLPKFGYRSLPVDSVGAQHLFTKLGKKTNIVAISLPISKL